MSSITKLFKKIFGKSAKNPDLNQLKEIAQASTDLVRGRISTDKALQILNKYSAAEGNSPALRENALAQRSSVHRYLNDYTLARADAKAAIAINPQTCEARLALAYLAVMENDPVKARRNIELAEGYSGIDAEKVRIIKKFVNKLCSSIKATDFYQVFTAGHPQAQADLNDSGALIMRGVVMQIKSSELENLVYLDAGADEQIVCVIDADEAGMVKMLSPGREVFIMGTVSKQAQMEGKDIRVDGCSLFF